MGQWKSDLIVRWMSSKTSEQQRYREITVHGSLSVRRERFITISSDKKGTIIYLEGKQIKKFPDVHLFIENPRISNKIILLGNTPEATDPWLGELFGLAIYSRALTLDEINQSRLLWMKPGTRNRPKVVIPVHIFGRTADIDPILAIARKHGLFVIEDACQAHGAEYKGKPAGSMGDAGCFSFYPGKNLGAYGDAGAVTTNNIKLAERMYTFRDHGQAKKILSRFDWMERPHGRYSGCGAQC